MAPTVNIYFYRLNCSKRDFSSPNEAVVLPNYIKSCMAQYNNFCGVCSIREYLSNVFKLTRYIEGYRKLRMALEHSRLDGHVHQTRHTAHRQAK